MEFRNFGIGAGYVFGDIPREFEDLGADLMAHFSGHVRFGPPDKINVVLSILESSPYASGGGYYTLSLAARLTPGLSSSVGFSKGPYWGFGLLQRNRISISDHFALDLNLRIGGTEGVTEYGIGTGLVYRTGFGR